MIVPIKNIYELKVCFFIAVLNDNSEYVHIGNHYNSLGHMRPTLYSKDLIKKILYN